MKIIKQFPLISLIAIFLISGKTSTNKKYPINNLEKNNEENTNSEKKRMEIKFSCGEEGISEYLDDGWNIIEKIPKKKFAHGNLFLPQKIVIWKKTKDVK